MPTIAESGYKEFELLEWNGFVVPRGTPPYVVDRLARAVHAAVERPEVRQCLTDADVQPVGNRPDEFAAFLHGQMQRWGTLIESRRIAFD